MYAEMLSQDMVRDETQRRSYLETLQVEADRLTHLVSNVLAYARLERGRPGGRIEIVPIDKLLQVATQRLGDRATQANFNLSLETGDEAQKSLVRADPAIVEQILFNLGRQCVQVRRFGGRSYAASSDHRGTTGKPRFGCAITAREFRPPSSGGSSSRFTSPPARQRIPRPAWV